MTWINLFNGILQNLNWGVSHMNLIYCANVSAMADFKVHQLWKCDNVKIYLLLNKATSIWTQSRRKQKSMEHSWGVWRFFPNYNARHNIRCEILLLNVLHTIGIGICYVSTVDMVDICYDICYYFVLKNPLKCQSCFALKSRRYNVLFKISP